MALSIYNTLTRSKEPFIPLDPAARRVTIYNCGPTVYDHFHIGNARNFVLMDLFRRYLSRTYEVRYIQNLTDIDDKIIKRMTEENISFDQVREKYIKAYFEDADKLRIRRADAHPCATEFIPQMIELLQRLESKGMAYASNGSLYYRVRKFSEYGKLSKRSIDDMLEGARVEVSDEKEDPLDFVLWKAAKPGEPKWPSPWGEGRPGWHLECSTMSMSLLGETIDIHGGGIDLMFPHHENEIAQSESATGKPFVRFWLHNGFLNIDHQKMAKSLGNFLKIDQVLANYPVPAVRHFLMSAHYRSPLDYSGAALEESSSAVRRINDAIETAEKILQLQNADGNSNSPLNGKYARAFIEEFESGMDDDFNTPKAIAVLFDIVTAIHETRQSQPVDVEKLSELGAAGKFLCEFFGLEPESAAAQMSDQVVALLEEIRASAIEQGLRDLPSINGNLTREAAIQHLIDHRKLARSQKKFAVADAIRKRLSNLGIALEDHPQGTIWRETS